MLQRLMAVSMTVLLGCSGLACGTKARSSADAAMGAGTGGTSGAGGALDGGTMDGDAAGGSADGDAGTRGAAGTTTAGTGGAGGMSGGGGSGGTKSAPDASGSGGTGGGGAGGSNAGGDDGGPTDAGLDGPTCTPNVACTPNLPCKTGIVSCDTSVARCVATGNAPNGTLCGTNVFCVNGFCDNEGCGRACTPTNRCHTGTISCTTGTNICQDTGAPVPDGTSCGTDQACKSGVCVTCSISDGGCSS